MSKNVGVKADARIRDTLVGVNSAFDLFQQPVRKTHSWYWDWRALRGDFEVVGRDMWRAIGKADERRRRPDAAE